MGNKTRRSRRASIKEKVILLEKHVIKQDIEIERLTEKAQVAIDDLAMFNIILKMDFIEDLVNKNQIDVIYDDWKKRMKEE